MASVDRDRAFRREEMERLAQIGAGGMERADKISKKYEEVVVRVLENLRSAPQLDGKSGVIGSGNTLSGAMKDPCYLETAQMMRKTIQHALHSVEETDERNSMKLREIGSRFGRLAARSQKMEAALSLQRKTALTKLKEKLAITKERFDRIDQEISTLQDFAQAQLKGWNPQTSESTVDPITIATGNFYLNQIDLTIPGCRPISFGRSYNARDDYDGVLGKNWFHSYEIHLVIGLAGTCVLYFHQGKEFRFKKVGEGKWRGESGVLGTLQEYDGGYVFLSRKGISYQFDQVGRLQCFFDADHRITLDYDEDGFLRVVDNGLGSRLHFQYRDGLLEEICDHGHRKVSFEYDGGYLVKVIGLAGGILEYRYDESGNLWQVMNADGVCMVETSYDSSKRAIGQIFADGSRMELAYEEGRTLLKERDGHYIQYFHDDLFRTVGVKQREEKRQVAFNQHGQKIVTEDAQHVRTRFHYDEKGNIRRVTQGGEGSLEFFYDEHNRLKEALIEGNSKVKNTYDIDGHLTSTEDGCGKKREIAYNALGLPEKITRADGSRVVFEYDARGNLVLLQSDDIKVCLDYDLFNRIAWITDPLGNTTRYTYDEKNRIRDIEDVQGRHRVFCYDGDGHLLFFRDFDGETIEFTYNEIGKPAAVTDKEGHTMRISYNSMWKIEQVVMPDGGVWKQDYDEAGYLTVLTMPDGETIRYEYDMQGNCVRVFGPQNEKKERIFDPHRRLILEKNSAGEIFRYTYDREGRIQSVEKNGERSISMEYTEVDTLQKLTDTSPGSTTTEGGEAPSLQFRYSNLNRLEEILENGERILCISYGKGGRPDKKETAGECIRYFYDLNGNVTGKEYGDHRRMQYFYDTYNRLIRMTDSEGRSQQFKRDCLGRVVEKVDVLGGTTRYDWSANGNLKSVKEALGTVASYSYDSMNRLTGLCLTGPCSTSSGKKETKPWKVRFERDTMGRIRKIFDPSGQCVSYTYDGLGRLVEKTEASGTTTRISYGAGSRPLELVFQKGTEIISRRSFLYDSRGNIEEIREDGNRLKIRSEDRKFVLEYFPLEGESYQICYAYFPYDKLGRIEYPGGYTEEYRYDKMHRLIQKKAGTKDQSSSICYAYDAQNRLRSKRLDSGREYCFSYTKDGIMQEITCQEGEQAVERWRYGYDAQGNRTGLVRHCLKKSQEIIYTYEYDLLGRICSVKENGRVVRTYRYDAMGNRIEKTEGEYRTDYHYNEAGMLTSEIKYRIPTGDEISERVEKPEKKTYDYDADGKVIGIFTNGVLEYRYKYDAQGRLIRVENGKGEVFSYQYDPLGYRYKKIITLPSANANSISLEVLEIGDPFSKGRLIHRLLTGEGLTRKEWYIRDFSLDGVYESEERDGMSVHRRIEYLSDEWGTPLRSFGETEKEYRFDEFGESMTPLEEDTLENIFAHPVGFAGYRMDRESGSYYTKWRQYCAKTGRFMKRDRKKGRIDVPFTLNPYTYCFNMPTYFVDVDGAWPSQLPIQLGDPEVYRGLMEQGWGLMEEGREWMEEGRELMEEGRELMEEGRNVVAEGGDFWEWAKQRILKESFHELIEDDIGPSCDQALETYFEGRYKNWEENYSKVEQKLLAEFWDFIMGAVRLGLEIPYPLYPGVMIPGVSRYMSFSDMAAHYTKSEIGEKVFRYINFEREPDGVYHTTRWCWQRFFGYNDFYDYVFEGLSSAGSKKFDFTVEVNGVQKEYILWAWKGDYYNFGAGGELGIYEGSGFHRQCAVDTNLMMSLQIYKGSKEDGELIAEYAPQESQWWITGFNPDYQDMDIKNLTAVYVIDFSNEPELYRAFFSKYFDNKYCEFDRKNMTATITWRGDN